MNISSEAASKAIKDFEEYAAKLAVIESDSEIFKGFAKSLASARTDAQKFKALVNCKDYVYKASADIDGVEDYIELYESTLAEYNEMANTTNSNINEVNSLVVAVRTNAIAEAIMSVVNKIFNK